MPETATRRFDRREIIRAAIVKSIEMRAHLSALRQHEQALAYPSQRWIASLDVELLRWRYRQEKALRLDLRRGYTPRERVASDENDEIERDAYRANTGHEQRPWDEESAR